MANQHSISVFQLKCTKSLQWNHCSWSLGYLYRCSPTPSSSSCTILFYFFLPFPRPRRFNCLPPPLPLPPCWYLVNKPLRVAGMSADNVRGWKIVRKMKTSPRSEASRANVKFWGQSLSQGHYQLTYRQARKGFIYFISLRLIFISRKKPLVENPVLIWWRMRTINVGLFYSE